MSRPNIEVTEYRYYSRRRESELWDEDPLALYEKDYAYTGKKRTIIREMTEKEHYQYLLSLQKEENTPTLKQIKYWVFKDFKTGEILELTDIKEVKKIFKENNDPNHWKTPVSKGARYEILQR